MNDRKVPDHVVARVADPFEVFPLSHALSGLAKLVEEENEFLYSHYEDVAPKYRDVGLEQGLEGVAILIGAGFVAAQSILACTFAAVRTIRDTEEVRAAGGADLPRRKVDLYSIGAHDRNGVSDIEGINALANYFKHAAEWPYDWNELTRPLELRTAEIVSRLGLAPGGGPDNLINGAAALAFGGRNGLSKLGMRVQEWRESIQEEVKKRLLKADLLHSRES